MSLCSVVDEEFCLCEGVLCRVFGKNSDRIRKNFSRGRNKIIQIGLFGGTSLAAAGGK